MAQDRTQEAEQAVLGAMMLDPARSWAAVDGVLEAAHFVGADHRLIFGAMLTLRARDLPPDPITVIDELGHTVEAAGGAEYIASLLANTPSAANVGAYVRLVRDAFDKRKIVDFGERVSQRAGNGVDASEAAALATRELEQINQTLGGKVIPLSLAPITTWANQPEPGPRDWVWDGLIPAGKVTSLLGNGGTGKTLLALQIGLHVAMGRPLFSVPVKGGPVLGVFCEDDTDELRRRLDAACSAERITLNDPENFIATSREGEDSYLCTFVRDHIRLTKFYSQLDATVAALKPRLLILDTAADLFAGDFLSTPQVRQFLKIALGGLCKRHGCAVLLLAHPSAAGMASGDGGGFSTAWNNSVRSRLYLRGQRANADEQQPPEELGDQRMLELKKTNYGPPSRKIPVRWQAGCFVFDIEPIEGLEQKGARVKTTRVSIAALDYIRLRFPLSLGFREIFDALKSKGEIADGDYEERRKPLSRALRDLCDDGLVEAVSTPRGHYRARGST